MRRAALFLSGLLHMSSYGASSEPSCGVDSQTFDSKDVLCTFPQAAGSRSYEFIAKFSGGHDDTRASIQTILDGKPLTCEDGSKKELFAEDGDVSLYCRFVIPGGPASDSRLKVTIRWSHAEFTDFRLAGR